VGFGSIVHLDEQQLGVELSERKQCLHCQYIHTAEKGKRERIEDRG